MRALREPYHTQLEGPEMDGMTPETPPEEETEAGSKGGRLADKRRIVRDLGSPPGTEHEPKGYFAPSVVRVVVFYLIILNVLAAAVVGVLGIWEQIPVDVVAKAISSFAVLTCAALLFYAVNEHFG
ncbi:MAG TPA: hypothetical protein VMZ92_09090 [Planctomycetota bacterium]|nr:hypothetical protein [Planctomycetota bacterium]